MSKSLRISLLLAILAMLLLPIIVDAIGNPDAGYPVVNYAYWYRHLKEDNDSGVLIDYSVNYAATPTENITSTYIAAVMNTAGTIQIRAIAPYTSTHTKGYNRGLVWIYFNAADTAALITWGGTHTIRFYGNPTVTGGWPGTPPDAPAFNSGTWWATATQTETHRDLATAVLNRAYELELAWTPTWDMINDTNSALGVYGETYFTAVMTDIRTMAPTAFSGATTSPESFERTYSQTYAGTLAGSVVGTPLDFTAMATSLNSSVMFVSTLVWVIGIIAFLAAVGSRLGGPKVAIPLSIPLIIAGGLLGMVPLQLVVGLGAFAAGITAYILFYRGSGA